jgi:hypothetical protein
MTAAHHAAQVSDVSHLALESNRVSLRERFLSRWQAFPIHFAARAARQNRIIR